ncbi:inosine-uridine nucleoside N-ribohydrolase [Nocardia transvalensis]|uniref:Inosine-uridine nucleoside N-ribohydrolase n=1 Tax=Nocardia transvalensis TaxID=37333 RepID=A0A7W9PJW7_9NOCA|nr:nucleoside hydrolase [Nocardia transvalensis]MBB5916838.1 inosine-uridine nucleoside N-ribohydrolase [Nocardia transvalensis]
MTSAPAWLSPNTPLAVFTDIGDDVDDTAALRLLATDPLLKFVGTVDERPGHPRAQLARRLLDLVGRTDVRVVPGAILGDSPYWCADGLAPADTPVWCADMYDAFAQLCEFAPGPLRVASLGPLTDIAQLLITDAQQPAPLGLADRMRIVAMAGGLDGYLDPRAEHNVRMNPAAAHTVLTRARHVALVLADHTFVPDIAIDQDHPLYRRLAASPQPWAQLIAAHYRAYCTTYWRSSKLHDGAAASVVMGLPFVRGAVSEFHLYRDGRMRTGTGVQAWVSTGIDYPALMAWVEDLFFTATPAPAVGHGPGLRQLMADLDDLAAGARDLPGRWRT